MSALSPQGLRDAYTYDAAMPLDAASEVVHESADLRIERFEINSVNGQRVPGLLLAPVVASGPLPTLLVAHPATLDKAADYVLAPAEDWARRGAVCVTIDQAGHGERASGAAAMESFRDPQIRLADTVQTAIDWRRTIDYLETRAEVDAERMGFVGFSMGGMRGGPFVGVESRVSAAVFCISGAAEPKEADPDAMRAATLADSAAFAPMTEGRPTLVVAGERDDVVPPEATRRLYDALAEPKQIEWLPCGHWDFMPRGLAPIWPFFEEQLVARPERR